MEIVSRIVTWLSDHEAAISAVAAIIVIGGVVLAGVRLLVRRRGATPREEAPSTATEAASAADSSAPDLDPLTVPGFEGRPAIAVLPFDNLSGDPEQEYFADGIAEDLITRLSAWRDFPVIARNSSFTYKGTPVDVKQVSRELGVRYVVEAAFGNSMSVCRITAQLIDATSGAHVWAESYDRRLEDIFDVQDEIATAIAGAMGAKLAATEEERAAQQPSQDLTAYDLFMRGRHRHALGWFEGNTQERHAEARSCFERAIEISPRFAAAFAWLAITHWQAWHTPSDSPDQSLTELDKAARRSVLLDPELPVAHYALSMSHMLHQQPNEGRAAVRHAIGLDPSFARAYNTLGYYLVGTGELEEAIAVLDKGMRLSPRDPWLCEFLRNKGRAYFAAQRYEDAVECLKQSIATGRSLLGAPWIDLAASLAHLGRLDEAAAAFREGEARWGWTQTEAELRRIFSYVDPDFLERYIEGLRKAGLPE